ncbi:hypothetical protein VOWphi5012_098 [Vibrio phage phi50-12]|uniref:Uncharacterized protein n=1 Tax=Vibrio phage phi50-12 TaxID=2654972 RepID=A0A5P8PSU9_9CAUD|nr:phosphatase [Vibrio phage phi50-12]QFR59881.1 hypothetical protein VOWphi5012_098 [Vibrio phage phi50-12]
MPKYIKGLVDYSKLEPFNAYLFTGNSTIKSNGELVMGAGNAKAMKDCVPAIPKLMGKEIEHLSEYGLKTLVDSDVMVGAFQTKKHWKDNSTIELVELSVLCLRVKAEANPEYTFHLPMPAVGFGGLTVNQVKPLTNTLPSNVFIYHKAFLIKD